MTVNEATLFIIMSALGTKFQRTLALEKYVQHYGGLSQEAWEKVRVLIAEAEEGE